MSHHRVELVNACLILFAKNLKLGMRINEVLKVNLQIEDALIQCSAASRRRFFSCIAERARGIAGQLSEISSGNICPEGKNLLANVTNRAFLKLLRNRPQ